MTRVPDGMNFSLDAWSFRREYATFPVDGCPRSALRRHSLFKSWKLRAAVFAVATTMAVPALGLAIVVAVAARSRRTIKLFPW